MHSKIYQIKTAPIPADAYLTESDFCEHWFSRDIADNVSADLNINHEIVHFRVVLEKNKIAEFCSDNSFTILPSGRLQYFQGALERFTAAAQEAAAITLEDFASSGKCGDLVYTITRSFCDRFGWYVSSDEFGTIPFDEFLRNAEPGQRYYIGSVLDYHV